MINLKYKTSNFFFILISLFSFKSTKPKFEEEKAKVVKTNQNESEKNEPGENENNNDNSEKKESNSDEEIVFDFDKLQLKSFVEFVHQLKDLNYLPSADLSGIETSLSIKTPMNSDQMYQIFLTALESAGFSHIKVGNVYKIVKKDTKYKEPLEVFVGMSYKDIKDDHPDETIRFVTFLKNIGIQEVEPLIKSMLSPGAQIIPLQSFNGFVLTDRAINIKSALKVVNQVDNPGRQEVVSIYPLKDASATEVKDFLDQVIKRPDGSNLARLFGNVGDGSMDYFSSSVRVIAEERTNKLILIGAENGLERIEHFIKNYIEPDLSNLRTPIHYHECQHTEAEHIKTLLEEIISDSKQLNSSQQAFSNVKIEADKHGNKLLVFCNDEQDWNMIQQTINDIDKPQPQVAIESLIVEVSQVDKKILGGQLRNKSEGQPFGGINFQSTSLGPLQTTTSGTGSNTQVVDILGNLSNAISSILQGSFVVSLGQIGNIWAVFRALKTISNTSLISKVFLTTANNTEGIFRSGEERRVVEEQAISESGNVGTAPGYQSLKAETVAKFKPQINPEGLVNLKVDINIEDFQSVDNDKFEKHLETNVTVADGQVLVLGGFVKTKVSESGSRSPILGKIPFLRWLNSNKQRDSDKSYILIFISTTVIKPKTTPGSNLYTKMKLHKAYEFVEDAVETQKQKDPIHNWFFNPEQETYSHKITDFANARYQPTTVDIINDPYYRIEKKDTFLEQKKNDSNLDDQEWKVIHLSAKDTIAEPKKISLEDKRDFLNKTLLSKNESKSEPETKLSKQNNLDNKNKNSFERMLFDQEQHKIAHNDSRQNFASIFQDQDTEKNTTSLLESRDNMSKLFQEPKEQKKIGKKLDLNESKKLFSSKLNFSGQDSSLLDKKRKMIDSLFSSGA